MTAEPVLIVGGGTSGLAAAVALAARGRPSIVLESRQHFDEIDRGDMVHHDGISLLRGWGVGPDLDSGDPLSLRQFRIIDGDGKKLFEMKIDALLGPQYRFTAIRHADIARALHAAATRSGLVQIVPGTRATDLLVHDGRVHGVATRAGEYHASLTVVANGGRSALRDTHFGKPTVFEYGTSLFNVCVPALPEFRDSAYYVLDDSGFLVLIPLPGDQHRIGIQFATASAPRPNRANFVEWATRICRVLDPDQLEFREANIYHMRRSIGQSWWIPGAVALGDAAHVVHPAGGQGMNLGFQDAEALAAGVATADGTAALDKACARYAKRRRKALNPVFRRTHLIGKAGSQQTALSANRRLIETVDRTPPLKKALAKRLAYVR
ncbi:FAD-dependent oxidoreductase [Nocardia altamirensis]|uniref:FAD-dependent oxidoreductase n=1 Tax=Nocardia altamirensis TaxID=472158 RepID=UPI00083FE79B|nr:NAD(P)/FAD-dependent oxidoreductase [Nocardia altamirensis]